MRIMVLLSALGFLACTGDVFAGSDAASDAPGDAVLADAAGDRAELFDGGSDAADETADGASEATACSMPPATSASPNGACALVNDPACGPPCAAGDAAAATGYACYGGSTLPLDLVGNCLASPYKSGADPLMGNPSGDYCCSVSACLRVPNLDGHCPGATPYRWSCPPGPIAFDGGSGFDHCDTSGCSGGPCQACCDLP